MDELYFRESEILLPHARAGPQTLRRLGGYSESVVNDDGRWWWGWNLDEWEAGFLSCICSDRTWYCQVCPATPDATRCHGRVEAVPDTENAESTLREAGHKTSISNPSTGWLLADLKTAFSGPLKCRRCLHFLLQLV